MSLILYFIWLSIVDGRGGKLTDTYTGKTLKQDHITFNAAFHLSFHYCNGNSFRDVSLVYLDYVIKEFEDSSSFT